MFYNSNINNCSIIKIRENLKKILRIKKKIIRTFLVNLIIYNIKIAFQVFKNNKIRF